jgi:outer membrane lipase/esterase
MMPSMVRLSVAAALTLLPFNSALRAEDLPPIRQVVSFGDSLSDAGTYGFRFTTNPGLTFAQQLAVHYGRKPLPNEHIDDYNQVYQGKPGIPGPGGLNYAEGGARVDSAYSVVSQNREGLPISATVQVEHFLRQHERFAPDQLVTLYIGTNDAVYDADPKIAPDVAKRLQENTPLPPQMMLAERTRVWAAADGTARLAKDILAHGAKRLLVFELVDLGKLPWFHTSAARSFATDLGRAFNERLVQSLPRDPQHLLVIDTQAFADELMAHPAVYGFKHGAYEDACREDDQDYCFPQTLKTPGADQTFIFAAGEHMTSHANQLLADYVLRMLKESPLR